MTKEKIAEHLAKEIYKMQFFNRIELENLILKKLTAILQEDKGTLHKGTLIQ